MGEAEVVHSMTAAPCQVAGIPPMSKLTTRVHTGAGG